MDQIKRIFAVAIAACLPILVITFPLAADLEHKHKEPEKRLELFVKCVETVKLGTPEERAKICTELTTPKQEK